MLKVDTHAFPVVDATFSAVIEFDSNTFKGKIVYCTCDDPFESNFFKYFAANFNKLALKKLITTSYDDSPIAGMGPGTLFSEYNEGNGKRRKPKAVGVILDHVRDENNDGATDIEDVKLFLKRNKASRERYSIILTPAGLTRQTVADGEGERLSVIGNVSPYIGRPDCLAGLIRYEVTND